ncbi:MAG: galactokinase [Mycobacteriaceae bacterium]
MSERSDVEDEFTERFGHTPDGVWAAPGRVNIIGEHTDYNDGYVLPIALPHNTFAAVSRRDDQSLELASVQQPTEPARLELSELTPGNPGGWAAYPAGVLHQLREAGHALGGLRIVIDGQVPVGAGLSSSAALECSVALAVRDLFALPYTDEDLVDITRGAENDFVGAPTGMMDQYASLLCEEGHALFLDTRDRSTVQVPFDLAASGLALLVCDTGTPHSLDDGQYGNRRQECADAAAALGVPALRDIDDVAALAGLDEPLRRRARHVVTENARVLATLKVLQSGGDPRDIGDILSAGHRSLRDDFEISTPELDLCVDAALQAGAYGARLVGGGFGGSAIVLVDEAAEDSVLAAIETEMKKSGFDPPRSFRALPAAGAHRVR